jgi:hypothetical protein
MRSKRIRGTAAVACCGLLAGVGAAAARALEVPTLPVPTVSVPVPTVSVPVVTTTTPLPSPPPVPTPTVTSPIPTPTTTTSLPASIGSAPSPTPATGGSTGGTGRLLGGATGSGGSSSSATGTTSPGAFVPSGGATAPEGTRPGEKSVAVVARPTRNRPGVVTVRFALASARRVLVIVRGPLPSCYSTARFAVRGRRGVNALRFNGTVGKRHLPDGSYLVGVRPAGSSTVLWAAVHVGPRGAQPLPRRIVRPALDQCSSATATRALLLAWLDSTPPAAGGTAGADKTKVLSPQQVERAPVPEAAVLPFSGIEEAVSDLPPALGYFLIAVIGGSLLGLGFYALRVIRSPSA